jgi:hypothetical protein
VMSMDDGSDKQEKRWQAHYGDDRKQATRSQKPDTTGLFTTSPRC